MPAKVLLTDYAWPSLEMERQLLGAAGAELLVAEKTDAATLASAAADADAIMTTWARVTKDVIAAASKCRIVARLGIGLDNIDVACCTRHGIPVTNVPDYCTIEVAEHALALLLAMGRNVCYFHSEIRQGRYNLRAAPPMKRIAGQTLGIVGAGQIGSALAERSQALGMKVLATTRSGRVRISGVAPRSLEELLAESDFVSLHLPLTAETQRIINEETLALMKPGAFLINTARGGLIDHQALAAALAAGRLAGAALDVQDPEPPDLSQPPCNDGRVIVTPHAAFLSEQSLMELRSRAIQQVITRLQGGKPDHIVNPEAFRE